MSQYDVIVIGGGPAGYPCAIRAGQNKLKVACIDEWKNHDGTYAFGGTCLNAGCIPSKALLESSELFYRAQHEFATHGIKLGSVDLDLASMQKRRAQIVKQSTQGILQLFKAAGVTALQGHGKLLSGSRVEFTDKDGKKQELTAKHIVLAAGSSPTELKSLMGRARVRRRAEASRCDRCRSHRLGARQRVASPRCGGRRARSPRNLPADG
jgi:dihydrolipoamide dehydrogenase